MGKAVPSFIKMKSKDLLELMPERFSDNFEENKKFLRSLNLPFSKEIQNYMASFIARQKKLLKKDSAF